MARYAMAIDLKNCIGCHECAVACKMNNNLPRDLWYNRVVTDGGAYLDTARGEYPHSMFREHIPTACQHCSNPSCVAVCPTGASFVDEGGIVTVDAEKCIGCKVCIDACPYGARTFVEPEPEYVLDFAMGDWDAPKHPGGTVEKCTFCKNRLDRGEKPACMEHCLGRARYWGDLDDPESEISLILAQREYVVLHEEDGTDPNCFYLR